MRTSSNPVMELFTLHFPSRQGGGKGADSSNLDTEVQTLSENWRKVSCRTMSRLEELAKMSSF